MGWRLEFRVVQKLDTFTAICEQLQSMTPQTCFYEFHISDICNIKLASFTYETLLTSANSANNKVSHASFTL